MLDYFHASDRQAALTALINLQESFHEMYRICSLQIVLLNREGCVFMFGFRGADKRRRTVLRMRSDMAVLCDSVSQHHLAA